MLGVETIYSGKIVGTAPFINVGKRRFRYSIPVGPGTIAYHLMQSSVKCNSHILSSGLNGLIT